MFFNLIKEINRLRKEVSRLLGKGMSSIYLKTNNEKNLTFSNIRFSKLKKFVTGSVFGKPHLKQIPLNFKNSSYILKFRGLWSKTVFGFSII